MTAETARAADMARIRRTVRDAIKRSGQSPYRIALAATVHPSALRLWLAGEQESLQLAAVLRLCAVLGLRVVIEPS